MTGTNIPHKENSVSFPYALCSEVFKTPIEETIRAVAALGFQGIEIAPFTIEPDVNDISDGRRREIRRVAEGEGIQIIGLHWLLVSPEGLHLTSPDAGVRERTTEYLQSLARFCADLGGQVMVLGSPKQRNIPEGESATEARARAIGTLAGAADVCGRCGVHLLLEALHPNETNFLQTIEDVLVVIEKIDHPNVGFMLDCKAMSGMPRGIIGTIEQYGATAGHFHANDPSGAGPGMGNLEFGPVLEALRSSGYEGWVSSEPFQYEPDSETVARTALETLKRAEGD